LSRLYRRQWRSRVGRKGELEFPGIVPGIEFPVIEFPVIEFPMVDGTLPTKKDKKNISTIPIKKETTVSLEK